MRSAGPVGESGVGTRVDGGGAPPQFWCTPGWACLLSGAMAVVFFVADVIMPRGATVAIGYCAVPAVAATARRPRFLLGVTITCTLLTWVAFFLEPAGYAAWKSVFDRAMVTAVLWFALALVRRRAAIIEQLVRQKQALDDAARELQRANGELSNFASVVAHDLRGPLNTIGLLTKLLAGADPIKADPECGASLESIRAELAQVGAFIQSLLAYGRVGAGDVQRRECDCASVLGDVRRRLRADLEASGAEVSNDPLPVLRADPVLISELFQNLIENAIKYRGEAAPRVHVSAAERPDGWLFAVRDNGVGVPTEQAERIFEPFYQADGSRHLGGGVGLGLATCKRIVERHGGRIHARSAPGEGTTFLFTIDSGPGASAEVTRPEAPISPDDPVRPVARAG